MDGGRRLQALGGVRAPLQAEGSTEVSKERYIAPPNHYSNQKLQDVWLSED
jgi:hypothetical protein